MALTGRPTKSEQPEDKGFLGFYPDGRIGRSSVPFHNAVNDFCREIVGAIRREHLSPAEVLTRAALERNEDIYRLFSEVDGRWSKLDRFYLWGCAGGGTAAVHWVASFGGRRPWQSDPNAWQAECALACKVKGYTMPTVAECVVALNDATENIGKGGVTSKPKLPPITEEQWSAIRQPTADEVQAIEQMESNW